ncbi:Acg family FMN-binding oxidoreductase [Actinokineospora guangxiensis]|uniref:Acg family FMN-binding oxidoreductase n=1 Tax=Actinokineospora guangxiensis TaxID=1490288 RepID=A0ABW0EKA7_9PSEU
MSPGRPDDGTIRTALALAGRAPSVHNTQPWLWRLGPGSVHLVADEGRRLPATDPDGRDLLVSCGAALHHLRAAFAGLGWATRVHRLPNPADPTHLAAVEPHPAAATDEQIGLISAIGRRRTDRRGYSSWPVPVQYLDLFAERAAEEGVLAIPVTDGGHRQALTAAIDLAAVEQDRADGYGSELRLWTGRGRGAADGVPMSAAPAAAVAHGGVRMRDFSAGTLTPSPADAYEDDAGALLVLATSGDDALSRLRAGEAASAVLLAATAAGMATCPLSQPLEVPATRAAVRDRVLDGSAVPQLVLRVGWPHASAAPLPASPRRPVAELLTASPGAAP